MSLVARWRRRSLLGCRLLRHKRDSRFEIGAQLGLQLAGRWLGRFANLRRLATLGCFGPNRCFGGRFLCGLDWRNIASLIIRLEAGVLKVVLGNRSRLFSDFRVSRFRCGLNGRLLLHVFDLLS